MLAPWTPFLTLSGQKIGSGGSEKAPVELGITLIGFIKIGFEDIFVFLGKGR